MSTTLHSAHPIVVYGSVSRKPSVFARFIDWAAKQDASQHIGWLGVSVISMTAVFFPMTMTAILFHGGSFGLIIAAMTSLVLVVVTNLAALPTKYTIPFFLLCIAIDVVVIGLSFFIR